MAKYSIFILRLWPNIIIGGRERNSVCPKPVVRMLLPYSKFSTDQLFVCQPQTFAGESWHGLRPLCEQACNVPFLTHCSCFQWSALQKFLLINGQPACSLFIHERTHGLSQWWPLPSGPPFSWGASPYIALFSLQFLIIRDTQKV